MKNIYFFMLALLGLTLPAVAQRGEPVSDVVSSTHRGVYFTDAATGYIAGDAGVILKTINGGATWQKQNSGTDQGLFDVVFTSATTGYCVGAAGTVLKTTNGTAWTPLASGTTQQLKALCFPDASTGYTVGTNGTILKTTNAGGTWSPQTSNTTWALHSVYFVNATTGFAVGTAGTVLKTTNGGATWTAQSSNVGTVLRSVHFADLNNGYIVGEGGTVLKTTNGGTTWTAITIYSTSRYAYTKVRMNSLTNIFLTSVEGIVNYSTDGGTNWGGQNVAGEYCAFQSFFLFDANNGVMVGSKGGIYKTQAGPGQWSNYSTTAFHSILFPAPNTVYAVSQRRVLKTTDGGNSWSGTLLNAPVYSAHFASATVGYAVGEQGRILKTTNGTDWVTLPSGTTNNLWKVFAVDANNVYVVSNTNVLKTTNGGTLWLSLPTGSTSTLNDLFFLNVSTGFMSGSNGTHLKTTDGGVNWTRLTTGTTDNLSDIYFADENRGYVLGSNAILKTTDGGISWVRQNLPSTTYLFGFCFPDANTGYVAGTGGTLLKTVDGGANWVKQNSGLSGDLFGINFSSTATGFISEVGNTLLRYVPVPQINVKQAATLIPAGSGTHALGNAYLGVASTPVAFTITNTGDLPLGLTGTSGITITGANAADFVLNTETTAGTVASGASTSFTLALKAGAVGIRTATVSIRSTDPYLPVYSFTVTGTGVNGPEINVRQDGRLVTALSALEFDTVRAGSPKKMIYTIENLGNENLVLSDTARINPSMTGAGDYTVDFSGTTLTIPAGGSTTFAVLFNPVAMGKRSASVLLKSNDSDENEYYFYVNGVGIVEAPTMQAHSITFTPTDKDNEITIGWTNGNGTERVVMMRENGTPAPPQDGKTYFGSPFYNSALVDGGGCVVYRGRDSSVTVGNLTSRSYTVAVYECLGEGNSVKYNVSQANGNPATRMITAVAGPGTARPFRVWPNPVREQLRILAGEIPAGTPVQLWVYNASGRTLLEARGEVAQLERAVNAQLGQMAPGLYFLKLQSTHQSYRTRFIKQ